MSTATTNKSQPADPLLIATISESGVHNWTWTDSHPLLTRANLRYTSDLAGSLAKFSNYVRNSYRSVPLEDIKAAASQGVELAWYSMLFTQVESWLRYGWPDDSAVPELRYTFAQFDAENSQAIQRILRQQERNCQRRFRGCQDHAVPRTIPTSGPYRGLSQPERSLLWQTERSWKDVRKEIEESFVNGSIETIVGSLRTTLNQG
ncbi:hypothetical protein M231_06618 [Tremella mesenterica]|uniref:Uncharacterized protein n=1 Tax=Tremella mesenterica TaxID=5217 RepID=A0A4Q1BD87_TREME|nr:hypothetical protein M231_06618 [Tremella mesenterica]